MPCTAVSGLEKETRDFVWSACFHCGLFLCTYRVPPLPSSVPSASSLWSFRQIRLVSMSVWMLALLQGEIMMSRAAEGLLMCSSVFTWHTEPQHDEWKLPVIYADVVDVSRVFAGQYTCKEGKNSPCLVYVSFSHKIYVYWKVELEHMESTNLLRVLEEKPEFKSRLRELRVGKYASN